MPITDVCPAISFMLGQLQGAPVQHLPIPPSVIHHNLFWEDSDDSDE